MRTQPHHVVGFSSLLDARSGTHIIITILLWAIKEK